MSLTSSTDNSVILTIVSYSWSNKVSINADTSQPGSVIDGTTYYTNKVTIKNLKPDTTYWYQVKTNGKWQAARSLTTGNPDEFAFMYVGDPQIGASKGQTSAEGNKQDGELAANLLRCTHHQKQLYH